MSASQSEHHHTESLDASIPLIPMTSGGPNRGPKGAKGLDVARAVLCPGVL